MKRYFFLLLMYFPVFAQDYKIPPDVITSLIEADPQPSISFNEDGSLGLVLRRDGYQSIEDLAKDELRIAGTRLDPVRYTSSRMRYYKSFSLLNTKTGLEYIEEAIEKLSKKHKEHMLIYGKNNERRMTGEHETASYDKFTHGKANRGASVRIGNETYANKKGYFEDRRPGSNIDPYLVTSKILETSME